MREQSYRAPTRLEIIATAIRQRHEHPTAIGQLPIEYIVRQKPYRDPSTQTFSVMTGRGKKPNTVIMRDIGTDPDHPEDGFESELNLEGYGAKHSVPFLRLTAVFWPMLPPDNPE